MTSSPLINCDALNRSLGAENRVVLDATFFLPRQLRDARAEYRAMHIPGALFFDIDEVADLDNPLPHTLPSAEHFAEAAGTFGIDNDTDVVVYDNNHFFAAARVWWMFRVFGHDRIRVLDGGLVRWRQLSFAVDNDLPCPTTKTFHARYRPHLVRDLEQMRQLRHSAPQQILDARSPESFQGIRPSTEPLCPAGHMPGSLNIPYAQLTDPDRQTLLPTQNLKTLFEAAAVDLSKPLVCSCGSGVSAAVLALALSRLGMAEVPVYDGSWAEWGRLPDTPKRTLE
ncbi:MAG: sulfurtransferase [Gammaproteobacteria bacterium]